MVNHLKSLMLQATVNSWHFLGSFKERSRRRHGALRVVFFFLLFFLRAEDRVEEMISLCIATEEVLGIRDAPQSSAKHRWINAAMHEHTQTHNNLQGLHSTNDV